MLICDLIREEENDEEELELVDGMIQYSGQDFLQNALSTENLLPVQFVDSSNSIYIDHFFAGFSESKWKYEMKPWLRKRYPSDFWICYRTKHNKGLFMLCKKFTK